MTIRHKIEAESVTLILLASVSGFILAYYTNHKPYPQNKINLPVAQIVQEFQAPSPIPTPTVAPKPQTASQISPDGTKQLIMTTTVNQDLTKTYVFKTSDVSGTNQQTIYTVINTKDKMEIPFNTWSPDNKYVFVTQTSTLGKEAIVLKADGSLITETEAFINATRLFVDKITDNSYDETTGWASETLLLVNTKNAQGEKSTSYWFEVPSKAIIALSTQF